jgi:hypothetical protein
LDTTIPECYVGHTTNVEVRKRKHKSCCLNANTAEHHLDVYQFIRAHGGWNNWKMEVIEQQCFANQRQAELRERELIDQFQPSLNRNRPAISREEYLQRQCINVKNWIERNREQYNAAQCILQRKYRIQRREKQQSVADN